MENNQSNNMKNIIFIGIGVAVVLGAGAWYLNNSQKNEGVAIVPETTQPVAKAIEVTVAERVLTPNMVTVTEGDSVTMRVTTDETGEFHISGYEIENDMEAGKVLDFSFTADKPGRYNFELHPKAAEGEESHEEETSASTEEAPESAEEEHNEAEEDIVIGAFIVNPK